MTQQSNNVLAMWQAMMQFAGQVAPLLAKDGYTITYVNGVPTVMPATPAPAATTQGAAK